MFKTIAFLVGLVVFLFFVMITIVFIFPYAKDLRDCHTNVTAQYKEALKTTREQHLSDAYLCTKENILISNYDVCIKTIKTAEFDSPFLYNATKLFAETVYQYKNDSAQIRQAYQTYCVVEEQSSP